MQKRKILNDKLSNKEKHDLLIQLNNDIDSEFLKHVTTTTAECNYYVKCSRSTIKV